MITGTIDLSYEARETRFALFALIVPTTLYLITPNVGFRAILVLIASYLAAKAVFHGSAWITLRLSQNLKLPAQLLMCLAVVSVLALVILGGAPMRAIPIAEFKSIWFWVLVGVIAYICYSVGRPGPAYQTVPVRRYLVAAGVLFVLCWIRAAGIIGCDDTDETSFCIDSSLNSDPINRTRSFIQFLVYISTAYVAMVVAQISGTRRKRSQ